MSQGSGEKREGRFVRVEFWHRNRCYSAMRYLSTGGTVIKRWAGVCWKPVMAPSRAIWAIADVSLRTWIATRTKEAARFAAKE